MNFAILKIPMIIFIVKCVKNNLSFLERSNSMSNPKIPKPNPTNNKNVNDNKKISSKEDKPSKHSKWC